MDELKQLVDNVVALTHGLDSHQKEQLAATIGLGITSPYGGIKAVSVGSLMSSIETSVAGLTNDQMAAIHGALSVAFDGDEEEEEGLEAYFQEGEEEEEELLADDDLVDEVVEEVLAELEEDEEMPIEAYFQDEEEEEEPLEAYFQDEELEEEELMAYFQDEEEEELPIEAYFQDEEEEELPLEAYFQDEEEEEEAIESAVRTAVSRALRRNSRRKGSNRKRAVKAFQGRSQRPPYSFGTGSRRPTAADNAIKVINQMRFGETDAAIKTVAMDLYGSGYDQLRYDQHRAFNKFVRGGDRRLSQAEANSLKTVVLTPWQIESLVQQGTDIKSIKADMSEILLDLGGVLVPEDFRTDMIQRLPGLTVVRSRADVGPTGSDVMTRVKVTGGDDQYTSAVRATWVGDTPTAGARTAPTFGIERTPVHIQKATVYVPMSLLEDTPFPLTTWINTEVSSAFAISEDDAFLVGDGSAKPEGVLPANANLVLGASQEVVSGAASALTADGIIDLVYGLAEQYWAGAVFVLNRATAKTVRKFKDGEGNYLWEDSYQAGQPAKLLGYPVAMTESMPDIASNAYPLIYGDFKQGYQIADRIGMSVVRDDVTKAEDDIIRFLFRRRLGGQVKAEWAFVVQKVST